jgi:RNA ligase
MLPTYKTIIPYVEKGLVTEKVHPENDSIRIFNYTPKCQFDQMWDDVTMQCRGLILNTHTGECIARPLRKFFNYSQWIDMGHKIPDGIPHVAEKIDGSLGILYWLDDTPWIATRGSFTSDQAIWATEWIRRPENISKIAMFNHSWTYLFEIIYPANRIVVQYDFSELVWLGAINKQTGVFELPLREAFNFKTPDVHRFESVEKLTQGESNNREGFVLYYDDLMLKIKFEEYVRLHKILTGLSEIGVWELLRDKGLALMPIDVAQDVPDEFFNWLTTTMDKLKAEYTQIYAESKFVLEFASKLPTRREQAEYIIKSSKVPGVCFTLLDNKDATQPIFKLIRPHGAKTFAKEADITI